MSEVNSSRSYGVQSPGMRPSNDGRAFFTGAVCVRAMTMTIIVRVLLWAGCTVCSAGNGSDLQLHDERATAMRPQAVLRAAAQHLRAEEEAKAPIDVGA